MSSEIRYGKWETKNNIEITCTYCNSSFAKPHRAYYRYCPNCGAEMVNDESALYMIAIRSALDNNDLYVASVVVSTLLSNPGILNSLSNTQLTEVFNKIESYSKSENSFDDWGLVYNKIEELLGSRGVYINDSL